MKLLEVGATFCNRFRLVGRLGTDVLGEGWRAHDRESSADVALLFLELSTSVDDASINRFAEALRTERIDNRRFNHPGIVRIIGNHADDGRHFLSTQLVDGADLASQRDGSIESSVETLLRVCDPLEYAHGEGFVHGAITRASIRIDGRGRVHVVDFGVARLGVAAQLFNVGRGSLATVSPQILDGQPATVADDIYAMGALLFELVTGEALFGDSVTRDRIIGERPDIPAKSKHGESLPQSLVTLLEAMLDKQRQRRPAGIAAVRAVLSDVLQDLEGSVHTDAGESAGDGHVIKPVERRRPVPISAPVPASGASGVSGKRHAFPAALFYGACALLGFIALGVLFVLPRIIENNGPIEIERPSLSENAIPVEAGSQAIDPRTLQAQKELAEGALGKVLAGMDQLTAIGVDLWGGADWSEARRLAVDGDAALKSRNYTAALGRYQQSAVLLALLQGNRDTVRKQALSDGQQAYLDNDEAAAVRAFEIVLAIDKDNAAGRQGLERAMLLPKLIELAAAAGELEAAGDFAGATNLFKRARSMDADWQIAQAGINRLTAIVAQNNYETSMAQGYSALSNDDLDTAGRAFKAARAVRPGDSDAATALSQIANRQKFRRFRRISVYQVRANEAAVAERWGDAISAYESALEIDATVDALISGLADSRSRAELDLLLRESISKADQFNRESVLKKARAVLGDAGTVDDPGPILQDHIDNLSRLLALAQIPIPVSIESDNLTQVSIHRVGQFGLFVTKTVNLKPGKYVAVGVREGFRDVRQEFLVTADGSSAAIVVRCEEPI